jgi:hypothetical protein
LEDKARPRAATLPPLAGSLTSSAGRELRYWDLVARLLSDEKSAYLEAEKTLSDARDTSEEFRWRIAAIAAAGARTAGQAERGSTLAAQSHEAFERLRTAWAQAFDAYAARPDLAVLRRNVEAGALR